MELAKMIIELENLRKKLIQDSDNFLNLYMNFEKELRKRFDNEYLNNKGSIEGLEDFRKMVLLSQKNCNIIRTVNNLLKKNIINLKDFEIIEENR